MFSRIQVVAAKTARVGAAVDGDGPPRCSRCSRCRSDLGGKRWSVSKGEVCSNQGAKKGGEERRVSASATFTGLQQGAQWRGQQGGEEFLSSLEVVWWWKGILVAKWLERRSPAPFCTAPGGARWTRCGEAVHNGRQRGIG
jgi:hypothetical protein